MSITNADLIRDALGQIGVLGEGEAASPEQLSHALNVLNNIMADWEADGVNLEFFPQTQAGEETPIPNHAISGVTGFLAFALAPSYGKQVSPEFVAANDKFYSRLVRTAVKDAARESSLSHLPGNESYGFDITTRTFT